MVRPAFAANKLDLFCFCQSLYRYFFYCTRRLMAVLGCKHGLMAPGMICGTREANEHAKVCRNCFGDQD